VVSALLYAVSVFLFATLLAATVGGVACLLLAERSPHSEAARRLMEHEAEREQVYSPPTELLSERGRRLRRRGVRLLQLAAATFVAYALFAFALAQR
jgi:hypothetical protein